ncbi:hypothetical protein BH23GEM9_BH23GEM9_11760 [soil metagenome]
MAREIGEYDEEDLRQSLATVEGIEEVLVDAPKQQVWLILRSGTDPQRVESEARALAEPHTLHIAVRPERRDRQRVRFVEVRRHVLSEQQAEVRVVLEWGGTEYVGTAVGDQRGPVELRTVAIAALEAVGAIVPSELAVRLSGVKQVRAFDEDLLIISLYRPGAEPRNLVGVVVIADDPRRAAAVAVLNALNRLLGNYLQLR